MREKNFCGGSELLESNENRLARLGLAALELHKLSPVAEYQSEAELNHLLQGLVDISYRQLGYSNCQFFLVDSSESYLEFRCGRGFLVDDFRLNARLREWRPALDETARQGKSGLIPWVATNRVAANLPDVNKDERYLRLETELTASELTVPLIFDNKLVGVLDIQSAEINAFDDLDLEIINFFASQAAAALLSVRVSRRGQSARQVARSLLKSNRVVSSQLEPDAVLRTLIDEVRQVLQVPICGISLVDETGEYLHRLIIHGSRFASTNKRLNVGKGFVGAVAASGRTWHEYDLSLLPQFATNPDLQQEGLRGSAAVPVKLSGTPGRIIGVLTVHDLVPRHFSPEEIAYLEGLADQAAVTIVNAENFAALKRERDMYHALLDNASDPILILEPRSGLVIDANRKAAEATGYSYAGLIGRPVGELFSEPQPELLKLSSGPEQAKASQPALVKDNVLARRKDKSVFPASYSAQLVQVGQERLIIQILRDMTERKAIEQQLSRNEQLRVLGQLASGVAHDFNNLLTGILGISEILLHEKPGGEEHRLLKMLSQAALDGAQMVRRVQMLGPGHGSQDFCEVDLNSLVHDVVELTKPRWKGEAQKRGAFIEVEVECEALPAINGNPTELREVITNLVFNAVDAMPLGGRLILRTELQANQIGLSVEDTGMGMCEETRRHLFEPFFTTKAKDGHGLGLSVSNSIIARHGGTIEVKTAVGKGSRFQIKLPLTVTDTTPPRQPAPSAATINPLRILIVDDDNTLLYVLTRILQTDQHQITAVLSGREAVHKFNERPDEYDLVFTDLSIPDLNGWELTSAIKAIRSATPVVLVTGWGAELEPQKLVEYGIAAVVNKPYQLGDVQVAILKAITRG